MFDYRQSYIHSHEVSRDHQLRDVLFQDRKILGFHRLEDWLQKGGWVEEWKDGWVEDVAVVVRMCAYGIEANTHAH